MERWERQPPRRGGGREQPSFSSTLLDAIYRSIDDGETDGGATRAHRAGGGARDPCLPPSAVKKQTTADRWGPATAGKAVLPRKHGHRAFNSNTSSSSDCSSYGGFSSSDTESVFHHAGLRPIRTGAPLPARSDPPPPPAQQPEKKKKAGSIGSRFRDLRKAKAKAPASPGARLASFLNSLFSASGNPTKAKSAAPAADEPACTTASSYSRSCLSKTQSSRERPPSAGGLKRSVRFNPVSVILDEDCRAPGQIKCAYEGHPTAARGREIKDRVKELRRRFVGEGNDDESDSSSDLFELETLKVATGGGGYRDELPVYETTHLRGHRAPSFRV